MLENVLRFELSRLHQGNGSATARVVSHAARAFAEDRHVKVGVDKLDVAYRGTEFEASTSLALEHTRY
jgi:hypothetical protein